MRTSRMISTASSGFDHNRYRGGAGTAQSGATDRRAPLLRISAMESLEPRRLFSVEYMDTTTEMVSGVEKIVVGYKDNNGHLAIARYNEDSSHTLDTTFNSPLG